MQRTLALAISALLSLPAMADDSSLTIYRSDGGALFEGGGSPVADGYAIVHEGRSLALSGGRQTLVVDGLPSTLDAEAVAIDFGGGARVLAQRVLAAGDAGLLAAHRGERVGVLVGETRIEGTLLSIDGNGIGVRRSDGRMVYVRDYRSVEFIDGSGLPGSTLQLAVDGTAGTHLANLTYPTSGLGWRAAYSAVIGTNASCVMRLEALASIANRSGRDYAQSRVKLVAGQPNFAKGGGGPQPMAMKAMRMEADALPEQSSLGDYRSFAIDASLDLPDASVTQVPLYAARDLPCQRSWVFTTGGAWSPPKPMLGRDASPARASGPVTSQLRFKAPENLPAGYLRVLTRDRDGQLEFLGENHLADTPNGQDVDLALGTAFDLVATRERTAFSLDRGARQMSEGFRITLENRGEAARTVTVREYPNRWHQWKLASSSLKPARQGTDMLEFEVPVAAGGKATLDLTLAYAWTAEDD